jgi:hypothetical protein
VPHGDVATYLARSLSERVTTYQARVLFHAPIERVRPRIPPAVGRLERVDATRCRLESRAHSLESLLLHLTLLGEEFEIDDPPELIEAARALSERLARAVKRPARARARRGAVARSK